MTNFTENSARIFISNFIKAQALQPADAIVVGITQVNIAGHHIIWLRDFEFIQNSNHNRNVHRPTMIELAESLQAFKRVQRFEGSEIERRAAIQRALRIEEEGRKYSWTNYNCEDFSSEVQTGAPRSKQVENVFAILAVVGMVLAGIGITKKNKALTITGSLLLVTILGIAMNRINYQNNTSKLSFIR